MSDEGEEIEYESEGEEVFDTEEVDLINVPGEPETEEVNGEENNQVAQDGTEKVSEVGEYTIVIGTR